VHPDEAVARGAAIYAQYLLNKENDASEESSLNVTNVNAHTLGLSGIDLETGRKVAKPVIPKNMSLPARKRKKFCTKTDGQQSIVVQVLEGESRSPEDCTAVARTVIRNLPPDLPKGHPIRVTFEYGANGRLNVSAEIKGTDRRVDLELERNVVLSPDRLARWRELITHDAGFHDFEAASLVEFQDSSSSDDDLVISGAQESASAPQADSLMDWADPEDLFGMAMMEERETKQARPVAAPRRAASIPQETQGASPPGTVAGSFSNDEFSSAVDPLDDLPVPMVLDAEEEESFDDEQFDYEKENEEQFSPRTSHGERTQSSSRWIIFFVGCIISSLIGLGIAYFIIVKYFPLWGLS